MADFYIQTDKDVYFAGETVNGQVFVNVVAMLPQAKGVSLKFSGYECVKWLEANQLHRPRPNPNAPPNSPPPYDPIAAIPPNQLFTHNSQTIVCSDVQSETDNSYDHRPKYIKTPANRYFQMKYYETRNTFTQSKSLIYTCNGMAPGQYSFPFSFKTFEGWPASFMHDTPRKKGVIVYRMSVLIEPLSPTMQAKYAREITLRETRMVSSQHKKSQAGITSCCCINKGITCVEVHFQKDGYMPGELVQMVIEVDNSQCTADIPTIGIGISNTVSMKSNGAGTADHGTIISKQINGVAREQLATGESAIRQAFNLNNGRQIKPTSSGKLLSNTYSLNVSLHHDISCDCCSDHVSTSIPIIIFPVIRSYNMPMMFQQNWKPQIMPATSMVLINNFSNPQINQMQSSNQGYPPLPPPNQNQNYPPPNQNYQKNQGYEMQNKQQIYPQQNQGYAPKLGNNQGQSYNQEMDETDMRMN